MGDHLCAFGRGGAALDSQPERRDCAGSLASEVRRQRADSAPAQGFRTASRRQRRAGRTVHHSHAELRASRRARESRAGARSQMGRWTLSAERAAEAAALRLRRAGREAHRSTGGALEWRDARDDPDRDQGFRGAPADAGRPSERDARQIHRGERDEDAAQAPAPRQLGSERGDCSVVEGRGGGSCAARQRMGLARTHDSTARNSTVARRCLSCAVARDAGAGSAIPQSELAAAPGGGRRGGELQAGRFHAGTAGAEVPARTQGRARAARRLASMHLWLAHHDGGRDVRE